MIDLDLLRADPALYQKVCKQKNIDVDIKKFLKIDDARKVLIKDVQEMQTKRNAVSKAFPTMKGAEKDKAIADMKKLGDDLKNSEAKLGSMQSEWMEMQLLLPSIPLPSVPIGKDDKSNVESKRVGEPKKFSFTPKDHIELMTKHGMVDIERGVKIAGARSYFLTGKGAELHLAVLRFTMDLLVKKGWSIFVPPLMAQRPFFTGTGFFPGAEEQIYAVGNKASTELPIEDDQLSLIGTSEVSVMSFHAEETLSLEDLPKKYVGYSSCFRREAGTYGKDTHGLYRIHQFEKVEQVVLCEADQTKALKLFEEIRSNAEEILQALELPYRIVDVCTGDMGRGKVFMQDIETWMPSRNAYGETHSCSYLGDFQCRRLGIKYKAADGKRYFCHSLNNTCIASPRILIPIIELYQQKDGSIVIPEVLRPYMQNQATIE